MEEGRETTRPKDYLREGRKLSRGAGVKEAGGVDCSRTLSTKVAARHLPHVLPIRWAGRMECRYGALPPRRKREEAHLISSLTCL